MNFVMKQALGGKTTFFFLVFLFTPLFPDVHMHVSVFFHKCPCHLIALSNARLTSALELPPPHVLQPPHRAQLAVTGWW